MTSLKAKRDTIEKHRVRRVVHSDGDYSLVALEKAANVILGRIVALAKGDAHAAYHEWHEQYGFHVPHNEHGHAIAHGALHLRMAEYHAAHGEHAAAEAHHAAHEAHLGVRDGVKKANPHKAGKLSDKAWAHSASVHDPAGEDPQPRRQPRAAHARGGFHAGPGSDGHRQAHGDLHLRMAHYHQARGEGDAAEAHWQAHQRHANGHAKAGAASDRAWSASAFEGAHNPANAPTPRATRQRTPKGPAISRTPSPGRRPMGRIGG